MDTNQTKNASANRAAIRELLDTYHGAINHRDWGALESVFTEDAVWEALPPINLHFRGKANVLAGLKQSVERQELLVQSSSGILIDFCTPGIANVRSTLSEFGREMETGKGWRAIAVYTDRVIQLDESWCFQRRTLQLKYQGDSPAPGEIVGADRQGGA